MLARGRFLLSDYARSLRTRRGLRVTLADTSSTRVVTPAQALVDLRHCEPAANTARRATMAVGLIGGRTAAVVCRTTAGALDAHRIGRVRARRTVVDDEHLMQPVVTHVVGVHETIARIQAQAVERHIRGSMQKCGALWTELALDRR